MRTIRIPVDGSVGLLALRLLLARLSNKAVAEKIRDAFSRSRMTNVTVSSYRVRFRQMGFPIPTMDELSRKKYSAMIVPFVQAA